MDNQGAVFAVDGQRAGAGRSIGRHVVAADAGHGDAIGTGRVHARNIKGAVTDRAGNHIAFSGGTVGGDTVVHRFRQVVDDAHDDVAGGRVAILVGQLHRDDVIQRVVAIAGGVVFVFVQRVAVGDLAGAGVLVIGVAGDDQRVAKVGGDGDIGGVVARLDTRDVLTIHGQPAHAIGRSEGEAAGGGFRVGARVAAVGQRAFVDHHIDLTQRRIGGVKVEQIRRQARRQTVRRGKGIVGINRLRGQLGYVIRQVDGQLGEGQLAVTVRDGVLEHVIDAASAARNTRIAPAAVRHDLQHAALPLDGELASDGIHAGGIVLLVVAADGGDLETAISTTGVGRAGAGVGTSRYIAGNHVAGGTAVRCSSHLVIACLRFVIDDVDLQAAGAGFAAHIGDGQPDILDRVVRAFSRIGRGRGQRVLVADAATGGHALEIGAVGRVAIDDQLAVSGVDFDRRGA